ncbi:MAG: hypothetical protein HKL90_05690 [Elusimicrobia bacterium]|nr:hypothetical protein [Elusimicrobiota bacterium]
MALEPGHPTALREPGYPLLIAGLYEASGGRHAWVVLAAQTLMSVLIAAMVGSLGTELFGAGVGAAAFAAYMLYPQAIFYGASLYRDTFVSFLFTACVWFTIRSARAGAEGRRALAVAGLSAGVLSVTSTAVALGAVPACALALFMQDRARGLRRAALFLLPVLAAGGAWTARNWSTQGRFVFGSTSGGGEIYQAMTIDADDLGTARQVLRLQGDPLWTATLRLPEAERNAALTRATAVLIAREPGLYARRVAVRLVKFWRLWPYRRAYDESYRTVFFASLASDAWMVPLGLLGFALLRRRWCEVPAVWLSVLALTSLYAAMHAVIRYRLPLMGYVILSSIAAASALGERFIGALRPAPRRPTAS